MFILYSYVKYVCPGMKKAPQPKIVIKAPFRKMAAKTRFPGYTVRLYLLSHLVYEKV